MRVVLIGGSGGLGRAVQPLLASAGHETVTVSRSGEVKVDLTTGEGLDAALHGSDVVLHLASDARRPQEIDVVGTAKLLDALDDQHLIYMSIVGVDRHPFPYYRAKRAAEVMIEQSGQPYSILRATQFHGFVEYLLGLLCRRFVAFIPSGFVFQPVSSDEVAAELARVVTSAPAGLQPDLAGPEILAARHLARTFMTARGREAPVLPFPVPGKVGAAFRAGVHTNPDRAVGRQTWGQYLEERFDG